MKRKFAWDDSLRIPLYNQRKVPHWVGKNILLHVRVVTLRGRVSTDLEITGSSRHEERRDAIAYTVRDVLHNPDVLVWAAKRYDETVWAAYRTKADVIMLHMPIPPDLVWTGSRIGHRIAGAKPFMCLAVAKSSYFLRKFRDKQWRNGLDPHRVPKASPYYEVFHLVNDVRFIATALTYGEDYALEHWASLRGSGNETTSAD